MANYEPNVTQAQFNSLVARLKIAGTVQVNGDPDNPQDGDYRLRSTNTDLLVERYNGTSWSTISKLNIIDDVAEGFIPLQGPDSLVASALRETSNRIISTKSLEVPPGTVYIGDNIGISAAILGLNVRDELTGRRALLLSEIYDDTGKLQAPIFDIAAISNIVINNQTGETANSAQFTLTSSNPLEIVRVVRVRTNQPSTNVDFTFTIRRTSHTGEVVYSLSETIATDANGIGETELDNPLLIDNTFDLYVEIVATGLVGSTVSGAFVPNSNVDIQVMTAREIADQNWVSTQLANVLHNNVAGEIESITEKTNPADSDLLLIEDSADSNNKKRLQIGNLPDTDPNAIHDNVGGEILSITEKTTINNNDIVLIEDSEDSHTKKRVTVSTLTGGQSYHTPTLQNLQSDLPPSVIVNTDLNTEHNYTFEAHNSANLASLILVVTSGTNFTIVLPISDGTNSFAFTSTGIDTSSAGTVTYQLRGTDTQGNDITSNTITVTIQATPVRITEYKAFTQSGTTVTEAIIDAVTDAGNTLPYRYFLPTPLNNNMVIAWYTTDGSSISDIHVNILEADATIDQIETSPLGNRFVSSQVQTAGVFSYQLLDISGDIGLLTTGQKIGIYIG